MEPTSNQFLVQFINSLGAPQAFFGLWAFIVLGAIFAFYLQAKKARRRNFKVGQGPAPKKSTKSANLPEKRSS